MRKAISTSRLTGAILLRGEHREFRFPVAQDVRLHAGQLADLADLEKEFFGDGNRRAVEHVRETSPETFR